MKIDFRNTQPRSWYSRRIVCGILCCLGTSTGLTASGQKTMPPPPVQNKPVLAADLFSTDLKILSRRLGTAFVAEGQPFPVTQDGPLPTLNADLPPDIAVREVANYFDYDVVRQDKVYLLTKRYTNPEDLPNITSEECRSGLKAVSRILTTFNPKFPEGTIAGEPMANIVRLLSTDQLARLGAAGLPVSELTPPQHTEVWRLALKFYLQDQADRIEKADATLENRNPADPVFQWQTIKDVRAFGYNTRSIELNKMLFIPVSHSQRIIVFPDGRMMLFQGVHTEQGKQVPDPDPTDPANIPEATKLFLDDKGKSSHTVPLAEAISMLNARKTPSRIYKVDAMYATKRVMLIGEEKLTSEELMRSLAAVYGLRVEHNRDGSFVLTHPLIVEATKLADLSRSLRSAIPEPIYRAMQKRVILAHKGQGVGRPILADEYQAQAAIQYQAARRMFRYVAEAEVNSQPSKKIALSHLSERERSTFMFTATIGSFAQAYWLAERALPPYISDFEHIILTGNLSRNAGGDERFSLHLAYRDPKTGEMYRGVGFSNAIVP